MTGTFLGDISAIAQAAASLIVSLFQSLGEIFVQTTGSGETAAQHLTIFGQLLFFAACVGLAIFLVEWIKNIITLRRN